MNLVSDNLVGRHLRQKREDKKMTIQKLAEQSGVSHIGKIENGRRRNPTLGTLRCATDVLDIKLSELFVEEDMQCQTVMRFVENRLGSKTAEKYITAFGREFLIELFDSGIFVNDTVNDVIIEGRDTHCKAIHPKCISETNPADAAQCNSKQERVLN